MALPPGFLDDLRARVPISDVVGRRVSWDARKSNAARGDWWACCPFHQEKSPSFHVDDRKGFYHCFGCHAKGDAIGFLREAENMPFMEAVATLAGMAGMEMPALDPEAGRQAQKRRGLADWMEAAVAHFRARWREPAAAAARDYMAQRGLSAADLDRFEIGFAPDARQDLLTALTAKGASEAELTEAGLIARPDDGAAAYDRFRDRIMFPIRDPRGACIAFGGRAMRKDARAKYLNSPQTPLFDKSRTLYNLGPARAAAGKAGALVVAEGYMDVIALARAGLAHAVAPLGTAMTEAHLEQLWRVADAPVLALDGDDAGRAAALRAVDLALPLLTPGKTLRVALLPPGRDPDDLVREGGAAAVQAVLDDAASVVDLLWRRETEGRRFDDPDARAALDKRLRALLARFGDDTVRTHYKEALYQRRRALFSDGRAAAPPRAAGGFGPPRGRRAGYGGGPAYISAEVTPDVRASALSRSEGATALTRGREAAALLALARHPALLERCGDMLGEMTFSSEDMEGWRRRLLAAGDAPPAALLEALIEALPPAAPAAAIGFAAAHADIATAETGVRETLARLAAEATRRREVSEAEEAMARDPDPALASRLSAAARLHHRESSGAPIETDSDESHLKNALRAAISSQIWKKTRRGGGQAS